jgi:hypothetical protein
VALVICTWLWGEKYGPDYVRKLAAGVRRNLSQPHRFIVIADRDIDIEGVLTFEIPQADRYLLKEKGCFARLRMFDPVWQKLTQIHDRLVCLDLDVVITGPLDPLFDRSEFFVILQGANAVNPNPYNGSVMMLKADSHPEVWSGFSLEAAGNNPFHEFPDDQGWIHHKISNAAGWKTGAESGIYAFRKPGWPKGNTLPSGARIVAFPGHRDPSQFTHLDWVKEHWIS